ncbi:glycosyltransferase family 39 protein [Nocardioides sp. Iso805N]|uniref:glycosyltransferase family 39 protein n=1 Tax=Nocardioides sp. Iso805N TaxID=1283287 RepID=UPI0003A899A9|nr:glycosyltransferase family 39 protein [Nocardioides sp. Iso805N]
MTDVVAAPIPQQDISSRRRRIARRLRQGGWPLSLAVGIVGALIAFWLRTIPIVSDPFNYVLAGQTFPQITWNMIGLTRYGIILPLIPITRLFHDSELTFYLTPTIATATLLACTHWLTTRFFGRAAGVAAAIMLLACSPVLTFSMRLYPDIFSASSTALAVTLAVASRDLAQRAERRRFALPTLLAATGLAVGASWWMRETSIFAWPIVAYLLLRRGGPARRMVLLYTASTALAMFVLELVVSQLAFGNWFARIHALLGVDMAATTNVNDLPYLNQSRVTYLLMIPRVLLQQPDGVVMLAEACVAVLGLIFFRRTVGLFTVWFMSITAFLILAGGALDPASPSIRLDLVRYWMPFLVPMIIAAVGTVSTTLRLAARGLTGWWSETPRRRVGAAAVVIAGFTLVAALPTANYVRHDPEFVVTNGGVMNDFRDWAEKNDTKINVLYTDLATQRQLPTYTRSFAGRQLANIAIERFPADAPPPPGSYVILFSDGQRVCGFCAQYIAQFRAAHPHAVAHWIPIWKSPGGTFKVYQVPKRGAAAS